MDEPLMGSFCCVTIQRGFVLCAVYTDVKSAVEMFSQTSVYFEFVTATSILQCLMSSAFLDY